MTGGPRWVLKLDRGAGAAPAAKWGSLVSRLVRGVFRKQVTLMSSIKSETIDGTTAKLTHILLYLTAMGKLQLRGKMRQVKLFNLAYQ